MTKSFAAIATFLGVAHLGSFALADGGYYAGNLGAKATGRGGAVVASSDGPAAAFYNPAGLAKVDGIAVQLGNTASHNNYSFTRAPTDDWGNTDPTTGQAPRKTFPQVNNGKPWQALDPLLGGAFGWRDFVVGLTVFAPPGIAIEEYPRDGSQRYMMVRREALFLEYVLSLAWKYHDVFGIGASAQWIHMPRLYYSLILEGSTFPKTGNPVTSPYDIQAELSGSSLFTFNSTVGAWYRPVPAFELAVSGQVVPADVVAKSSLAVKPIGSAMGNRITLSRNNKTASDVTLTLPMPLVFRAGGRYRYLSGGREIFDIELNVDYTTWSRVNEFTIATNGLQAKYQTEVIDIGNIHIPKRWRDSIAFRLGGDYAAVPGRLTVRAGGYYESAIADPAYANIDFAAGPQVGGGLGASIFFWRFELALAYQLRTQLPVSVTEANGRVYQQAPGSRCTTPYTDTTNCHPKYLGQPAPTVNAGTYNATSHFLAFDFVYRYAL